MGQKREYRSIVKATALFGGVQAYQILLTLVRTKVVALLLGVDGVGLLGLLNNTINMVQSLTGLAVSRGGVKSISTAENPERTLQLSSLVRRMSLYAGLIGTVLTFIFSSYLSQWSFGNKNFTGAYMWLSCTLLFDTLTKGELAIFQGSRYLKLLAKANVTGATIGLFISIPIYYIWHINGVVAAIIVTSICSYLSSFFYADKHFSICPDSRKESKHILKIGAALTISVFANALTSYLFNIYLRYHGGLGDIGIYQSGFGLIDKYVGLIFTAMITDYYPRLTSVAANRHKLSLIMNQQTTIALLILCPVIAIFLPTAPLIVKILLTESFLPVIPFLSWAILGMIFKVASTSLVYILIAKGDAKAYICTELLSWTVILTSNIIGYSLWGIEGIGTAFLFSYIFYYIIVSIICKKSYKITFNKEVIKLFFFTIIVSVSNFLAICYLVPINPFYGYIVCATFILITVCVTVKKLLHHIK